MALAPSQIYPFWVKIIFFFLFVFVLQVEGSDTIGFAAGGAAGGDLETTVAPYLKATMEFRDKVSIFLVYMNEEKEEEKMKLRHKRGIGLFV